MNHHQLEISEDDAVVLFEFFSRFDDTDRLEFVHPAEYVALQRISAQVDKSTAVMFDPEYQRFLDQARARVAEGFEGDVPGAPKVGDPAVAVIGALRFPPGRMDEVRPHLRTLVEATRRNDGCIAYDAAEDPFDPGLVRFSELWPDRSSLDRHLAAPHIGPWRAAARACGLIDRKFTAYDISGSTAI